MEHESKKGQVKCWADIPQYDLSPFAASPFAAGWA
jgi:hypothetical protein